MDDLAQREGLAKQVVDRLVHAGFRALYAGGCVRDRLLTGTSAGDVDIATSATPQTVINLFSHTVPVGVQFGVVIVVEQGVPFEVATFRADRGIADGRHPQSVEFSDERIDAQRRDFTINGMFFDPCTAEVLDYVGGRADLQARMIRAIGEPAERFAEDYLRMLRAVRFAARFDFDIEPRTFDAIAGAAGAIAKISAERVFQELDKMLRGPHPRRALELLHATGLLPHVLPEVAALENVQQPPQFHPEGDVLRHTFLALDQLAQPSQRLAWATLLHDIGKPPTFTVSDRIRFNNHDAVGATMAATVLERLRAPRALIDDVGAVIANHMHFAAVNKMKLSTLKRFLGRSTIDDEIEMHRADCLASHGMLDNLELLRSRKAEFAVESLKPTPLLKGRDLLQMGFRPGPALGRILDEVYDLQLEESLTTREQALDWVREHHAQADSR